MVYLLRIGHRYYAAHLFLLFFQLCTLYIVPTAPYKILNQFNVHLVRACVGINDGSAVTS